MRSAVPCSVTRLDLAPVDLLGTLVLAAPLVLLVSVGSNLRTRRSNLRTRRSSRSLPTRRKNKTRGMGNIIRDYWDFFPLR